MKLNCSPSHRIKINSSCPKDHKLKPTTLKGVKENIGDAFPNIGIGKNVFSRTISQELMPRKLRIIKTKILYSKEQNQKSTDFKNHHNFIVIFVSAMNWVCICHELGCYSKFLSLQLSNFNFFIDNSLCSLFHEHI